jgi:hypothetical protein
MLTVLERVKRYEVRTGPLDKPSCDLMIGFRGFVLWLSLNPDAR